MPAGSLVAEAAMSRTSIVQRTTEWRDARLRGIGSSEAAAAVGYSRWESPARLWAIKLGLVPERQGDPCPLHPGQRLAGGDRGVADLYHSLGRGEGYCRPYQEARRG